MDWRAESLDGQPYLLGVEFTRRAYRAYRVGWDHDHCAGCAVKFVEEGSQEPDAIYEGYATTERYPHGAGYEWVCSTCFHLFAGKMRWTAV